MTISGRFFGDKSSLKVSSFNSTLKVKEETSPEPKKIKREKKSIGVNEDWRYLLLLAIEERAETLTKESLQEMFPDNSTTSWLRVARKEGLTKEVGGYPYYSITEKAPTSHDDEGISLILKVVRKLDFPGIAGIQKHSSMSNAITRKKVKEALAEGYIEKHFWRVEITKKGKKILFKRNGHKK